MGYSTFTAEKARAIIDHIINGDDIASACRREGVPHSTFRNWIAADHEGIANYYACALLFSASLLEDECLLIVDDGSMDWFRTPKGPRLDRRHIRRSFARMRSLQSRADQYRSEAQRIKGKGAGHGRIIIQIVDPPE